MGVSKDDVRAVVLNDGRTCKMHLVFDHVRQVLPDADEADDLSSESLECDCAPSAEDVLIAIEEGDEDFLSAHGLLHLLDEGALSGGEIASQEMDNNFSNVVFMDREDLFEDDGVPEVCLLPESCRREKCDHKHLHSKVVYGPDGERLTKYSLVESHGVHGRKPSRPKRVTVRGATVRADIMYGPYGPRYVGLIAEVRKQN